MTAGKPGRDGQSEVGPVPCPLRTIDDARPMCRVSWHGQKRLQLGGIAPPVEWPFVMNEQELVAAGRLGNGV